MTRRRSLNTRSIVISTFALMTTTAAALLLGTAFSSAAQAQINTHDPAAGDGQLEGNMAVNNTDDNDNVVGNNNTSTRDSLKNDVTVSVEPFVQALGASVLVRAEGLSPNSNATITLGNVMIERETTQAREENTNDSNQTDSTAAATQTSEDDRGFTSIVAGRTLTDENGTLLFALGIPKEDISVETTFTNNSTGQETTVVDTLALQGTLQVVVKDQRGNTGHGEVTILAPLDNVRTNSTGDADDNGSNSSNTSRIE
jgi:hypothetical protein